MARNVGDLVCSSAGVCVVLLLVLLVLPATDSASNPDLLVEYSVAGIPRDINTAVQSLEDAHLHRVKRQQNPGSTTTPHPSSNNSSSNSSQMTLVTTAHPFTTMITHKTTTTKKTTTPGPSTAAPTQSPPTTQRPVQTTTKRPTSQLSTMKSTPLPKPQPQPQPTSDEETPSGTTTQEPKFVKDNHNYYTSTILPDSAGEYFLELDSPSSQGTLNSGHRLAVTISLPFKFRFYGHNITNVTVATGGFIYMSPFLHQWLTATQYIAPLMANFDTSTSPDSNIFYKQVGEEFVIEWHNVILKDQDAHGSFIFQAKLKADGTITFIYKSLPLPVQNISSTNHPVKIGLSDAFYNDTFLPQYGIKRRTIIEYHRVAFLKEQIEEGTVIILRPLPTCNTISDCSTCTAHVGVKFQCKWCERVSRCSDGLDWYRQDWEKQGCKSQKASDGSCKTDNKGQVAVVVAVVLVLVVLLGTVAVWMFYAYTHPTSASGIWLMEHRPSQMKAKLANMKFWKKNTPAGTKYAVESEA
ncbi:plexin domain-containing protein 1-like [Babylonia areolata]|uniref:plexin domain-containing protein 1-like n=1 Tax=Babylonia areolata TaxID=304850 RepID=UPI003FD31A48